MPNYTQIDNPKGAFGYLSTVNTPLTPLHGQVTGLFRNMSTARGITAGAAVVFGTTSTLAGVADLSTVDEGCYQPTTEFLGSPLFLGIALTSAAPRTTGTTVSGANAPSSEYAMICLQGPVYGALLTTVATAPVAGSVLAISNTTISGAGTGATAGFIGGILGVCDTVLITSAATNPVGVAGICLVPGTTGTTGFLTSVGNRGVVYVRPSITIRPPFTTA